MSTITYPTQAHKPQTSGETPVVLPMGDRAKERLTNGIEAKPVVRRKIPMRRPPDGGQIAEVEERPGYFRYAVNDVGGRVKKFERAGYTIVKSADKENHPAAGNRPSKMGSAQVQDAGDVKTVLMEIPIEHYEEMQAYKEYHYNRPRELAINEARREAASLHDPNSEASFYGKAEITFADKEKAEYKAADNNIKTKG